MVLQNKLYHKNGFFHYFVSQGKWSGVQKILVWHVINLFNSLMTNDFSLGKVILSLIGVLLTLP